jgi:hypothetical protein
MNELDLILSSLRTAIPGRVVSISTIENKYIADVEVGVKGIDLTTGKERQPIIVSSVPVVFPSSERGGLSWKVEKGDPVLLIVCDRDFSLWWATGQPSLPGMIRHHYLSDAFAIPGAFPQKEGKHAPEGLEVRWKAGKIKIGEDGKIAIGNSVTLDELLQIIDQLLDSISGAVVQTALGPQPLLYPGTTPIATFIATLKASLANIKGTL